MTPPLRTIAIVVRPPSRRAISCSSPVSDDLDVRRRRPRCRHERARVRIADGADLAQLGELGTLDQAQVLACGRLAGGPDQQAKLA